VFIAIEPGAGHAAAARGTVEEYDVGDRDMPPSLVIRHGKRLGFEHCCVYQHPGQLYACLYGGEPHGKFKKAIWRFPLARYFALFLSLLFLKRFSGVVFMRKPRNQISTPIS
jgi:hypothetical protein